MSQDILAEQYVLGACLNQPATAAGLLGVAEPNMFVKAGHATIAAVIGAMCAEGLDVNPVTVLQRLTDNGEAQRVGGGPYLLELMERWMPGVAVAQAERIREAWWRGSIEEKALRLAQRAENPSTDLSPLMGELAGLLEALDGHSGRTPYVPPDLDSLMQREETPDWLIPGLIERMERIMVTGFEGLGKSEITAQLAMCLAAGVHPWWPLDLAQRFAPVSVLVVDLENGWGNLRRRYGRHLAAVEACLGSKMDRSRLRVESRDAGLDLTRADDQAWLDRALAGSNADVLCIGALYKMHRSDPRDEQAARTLSAFLDDMRSRHGVAMVIEAHAGHTTDGSGTRQVRPRGSSLFLGWPNVGFGIRPHPDCVDTERPERVEVKSWRGQREERSWPRELRRGFGHGQLPWMPVTDSDRASYSSRRTA